MKSLLVMLGVLPLSLIVGQTYGQTSTVSVDHIVYATPDLQRSVEDLEQRLGVRPSPGGSHINAGTRNALLALGPTTYLEIVGPDLAQPSPAQPRPFGIDTLTTPKIVSWAIRSDKLDELRSEAAKNGVSLGEIMSVERRQSDGVTIHWRMTTPQLGSQVGLVPFYIDWGETPHPALTAAPGLKLVGLRAEHPNPEQIGAALKALGIAMQVSAGPEVALIATIEGPSGRIVLK